MNTCANTCIYYRHLWVANENVALGGAGTFSPYKTEKIWMLKEEIHILFSDETPDNLLERFYIGYLKKPGSYGAFSRMTFSYMAVSLNNSCEPTPRFPASS